ncbi:MAG: zinc ABC transporter substrate-binding protein [Bacteroidales bacterium]|jgi:zinc transport system substrate-binding protein|nr:zinc ABC transporter substrate-binding protein [Bacteroidales bacterium]
MRKLSIIFLALIASLSCNRKTADTGQKIITASIAPYKYFINEIAGDDFKVNVMVPAGANPHIYEPYPGQINRLGRSVAYISNGYLGFEMTWLGRFYEINKTMKKLSVGEKIDPIESGHHHEGKQIEGVDPHFWVSPECALTIASSVRDLLNELNPSEKQKYESNYSRLILRIGEADEAARTLFSEFSGKAFMIYHPNLAYLARDYGLTEISVEFEGKEPPPSRLKELIDFARTENITTIFVQKEYDSKNANAIAHEVGAKVRVIDPLSENWYESTMDIIRALHKSFTENQK